MYIRADQMGQTTFGRYRLIAELGQGGMADVFLAVQAGPAGSGFRKLTVIKRLRRNLAEEPEFVTMLVDEARIAARLNHPNVVQTNEVGEIDGQYFIAMEYLDGQPLHRLQHRAAARAKETGTNPCTKEQQYLILMDTLAGLHHAHQLSDFDGTPLEVVHRDVTPHNIFVTYEGQVKVVDFGIAKAVGRSSETRQGVVKGKTRYMAPEQALGISLDRRADLFPVGVMLWQIATGKRLWGDVDEVQVVQALVSGTFNASPRSVDPDVPEAIDEICRRALAVDPEGRYETADDFRSALEQYLADAGQLVSARKGLRVTLAELFDDKRKEIRAVIEHQLAALELAVQSSSGEFASLIEPPISMSSSSSSNRPSAKYASLTVPSSETQKGMSASSVPPPPGPSRPLVFGVIGAAIILATAGVGLASFQRPKAVEVSPAEAASISLRIAAAAPGARVIIDDEPPVTAPLEQAVPRDGREHKIKIEAPGHESRMETVLFAHDVVMNVELPKAAEPVAHTSSAKPPPPPSVPAWRPRPAAPKIEAPTPEASASSLASTAPMSTDKKRTGKLSLDNSDPWQDAGR